jgi:hypothetical protein
MRRLAVNGHRLDPLRHIGLPDDRAALAMSSIERRDRSGIAKLRDVRWKRPSDSRRTSLREENPDRSRRSGSSSPSPNASTLRTPPKRLRRRWQSSVGPRFSIPTKARTSPRPPSTSPAAIEQDPALRGMIGKKRAVRIPIKKSLHMVPLRGSTSMASSVCAMSPVSST